MEDYASNSKKNKEERVIPEKKNIERVTSGEVIVQKKGIGRKFKDLFIEADFRSVVHYVISEVMLPAARNMIVDSTSRGIERMMYGERASQRRNYIPGQPRITYNNPINRGYAEVPRPTSPVPAIMPPRMARYNRSEFILSSREEAALVLEQMNDIIDTYDVVSVADLNASVGYPTSHVDNKWGWTFLGDVQIRQTRDGFLLDLPPAEAI